MVVSASELGAGDHLYPSAPRIFRISGYGDPISVHRSKSMPFEQGKLLSFGWILGVATANFCIRPNCVEYPVCCIRPSRVKNPVCFYDTGRGIYEYLRGTELNCKHRFTYRRQFSLPASCSAACPQSSCINNTDSGPSKIPPNP